MVEPIRAPKWTPRGLLQRFRRIVREPSDFGLALRIGLFLVRVPTDLLRRDLTQFLARLRALPKPPAADIHSGMERIVRIRQAWLALRVLRPYNTCYVRALTLYRFLDVGDRQLGIHFGIEQPDDPNDRLRGHAWVTIDGQILEGPDAAFAGRIIEVPLHDKRRAHLRVAQ